MPIKVRFFASLAESVGRREVECPHVAGMTIDSIWRDLNNGQALPNGVLCAVNHSYCDVEQLLKDDDEVAYFPPVTGG